jgi:lipid-binding SYLF domain-containing protein
LLNNSSVAEKEKAVKSRLTLLAIVVLGLSALSPKPAEALTTPVSSLIWATQVIEEALTIAQGGIPKSVLEQARAIAVFPDATRSQLYGGQQVAEGIIVKKSSDDTWSNPALVYMWEPAAGLSRTDLTGNTILIFRNSSAIDALEKAPLNLGSGVTVEGGPLEEPLKPQDPKQAQIYSYSLKRGSIAGFSLTGAVLQFDKAANGDLYGKEMNLRDIFSSKGTNVPVAAGKFKCTLAMYTNARQMCG